MKTVVRSVWTPVIKHIDTMNRTIKFVGTKETEDRTGDIIEVAGWELDNFIKNPVFLWDHDPSGTPIGRVKQIVREATSLVFDVEFAPKEVSEKADQIFKLFEAGFLKAVSVGFIPKAFEPIMTKDGDMSGLRFTKQELLELSAVSIPAHQDALAAGIHGKQQVADYYKAMEALAKSEEAAVSEKGIQTIQQFTKSALEKIEAEANHEDNEMTKEQGDALQKEVAELKEQVLGLVSLQETVELSKAAMTTLNTLFAEKLSKGAEAPESKSGSSLEGEQPTPASDSATLTSALTALLAKVQKGSQANFTTEGDK